MTDMDRRAFIGRLLTGALTVAAGASLSTEASASLMMDALSEGARPDLPVEESAVRTTCFWRGGRRVCTRRRVRRVCWWRGGRRVCAWR